MSFVFHNILHSDPLKADLNFLGSYETIRKSLKQKLLSIKESSDLS